MILATNAVSTFDLWTTTREIVDLTEKISSEMSLNKHTILWVWWMWRSNCAAHHWSLNAWEYCSTRESISIAQLARKQIRSQGTLAVHIAHFIRWCYQHFLLKLILYLPQALARLRSWASYPFTWPITNVAEAFVWHLASLERKETLGSYGLEWNFDLHWILA